MHEAEVRDADGNLVAWASAGIVRSNMAGGDDWGPREREDPDERQAERLAKIVMWWWAGPKAAAGLRLPKPTVEDITWLWESWPDLARSHHLPSAAAWAAKWEAPAAAPERAPAGGTLAALVGWVRRRMQREEER